MQHFTGALFLAGAFALAGTSVIAGRFVCGGAGYIYDNGSKPAFRSARPVATMWAKSYRNAEAGDAARGGETIAPGVIWDFFIPNVFVAGSYLYQFRRSRYTHRCYSSFHCASGLVLVKGTVIYDALSGDR